VSAARRGRGVVLDVCHYYGPYPGNFIPSLVATGTAVSERLGLGHHCVFPARMQSRPWARLLQDAGIGTSFVSPTHRVGIAAELGRIAESTNAVLVRSQFTRWDIEAGLTARRRRAASVWHMHSGRFGRAPSGRSRAKDAIKVRALGGLCDRVFAVSDEIHRLAAERGFPERKIRTVLNGIDVGRFDDLPTRREARALLALVTEAPIALAFAWSPHTKGTDLLVEAARPLGEAGELEVVLVGDPSLAQRFGGPGAGWLRVIQPRDDVGTLFAASDMFVSSSRDEGFSYSIGEAMASRLPVISSDIAGPAPYFAAAGVTTFPSEDTAALAAALRSVLGDDDRTAKAEANRDYVRSHLDLNTHVNRVIELFAELIAERPA
jgi:glycosyltransferase involved in cell wall biosynthesis